jgi:mRNA-degrading endonuclease YafQ of YafQ-DinJ toxin-antitoxin module
MRYVPYESDLFAKQWKALCKKDRPLEERLTKVVHAIIENPENFDSPLQGNRKFSVKKKAVGEHYRIVYRYCERCIQIHKSVCDLCENAPKEAGAIIFEEVFHRSDGY